MQHCGNEKIADEYAERTARRVAMIREVLAKGVSDPDPWRAILTAFFLMHVREKNRLWVGAKFVANLDRLALSFERRINPYSGISFLLRNDGPSDEWKNICNDIAFPTPDLSWAEPTRRIAGVLRVRLKATQQGVESIRMPILDAIGIISEQP